MHLKYIIIVHVYLVDLVHEKGVSCIHIYCCIDESKKEKKPNKQKTKQTKQNKTKQQHLF
jgi:hypothetical protein